MKIIKTILEKPYLLVLIALIIAFATIDASWRIVFFSVAVIFSIFIAAIIYTIIQKKWLRLLLSTLSFIAFLIVWLGFIFFKGFTDELKPLVEVGDFNFYKNEIAKSSNLKILPSLKMLSKLDTIVYMGIENEYDAECLYYGPSKLIIDLEKEVISQKEFNKVSNLENYPTKIITEKNFNLNELRSVYKKESQGRYIIYIAFNKNNSKFYYSAFYY